MVSKASPSLDIPESPIMESVGSTFAGPAMVLGPYTYMLPFLSSHLCRLQYSQYTAPLFPIRKLQGDGEGAVIEVTQISKAALGLNPGDLTSLTSPLTSEITCTFTGKHPCPQRLQSVLCLSLAEGRTGRELSCRMRNLNQSSFQK